MAQGLFHNSVYIITNFTNPQATRNYQDLWEQSTVHISVGPRQQPFAKRFYSQMGGGVKVHWERCFFYCYLRIWKNEVQKNETNALYQASPKRRLN